LAKNKAGFVSRITCINIQQNLCFVKKSQFYNLPLCFDFSQNSGSGSKFAPNKPTVANRQKRQKIFFTLNSSYSLFVNGYLIEFFSHYAILYVQFLLLSTVKM